MLETLKELSKKPTFWNMAIAAALTALVGYGLTAWLGSPWLAPWLALGNYVVTPMLAYTGYRLARFRRLLAEGYSIEDARLAVRDHAERRREEVSYEYGHEPPMWARIDRALMIASGTSFFGLIGIGLVANSPTFALSSLAAAGVWFVSALLQTVQPGKPITRDVVAEERLKFWNGRLGRWFDKLARIGLKKRAIPAELTYRPTEMAISLAADALFESLPKEIRKGMKDLPRVMERLQHDAAIMRRTVDELDGALASLGDHPDADLVATRDEAARRQAEAIGALESVRLSLLKLKAGTGSVSELTADLTAARALTEAMNYAVQGNAEVARLLAHHRTPSGPLVPKNA